MIPSPDCGCYVCVYLIALTHCTVITVALMNDVSREDYIEILKYAQERNVKVLPSVSETRCYHIDSWRDVTMSLLGI